MIASLASRLQLFQLGLRQMQPLLKRYLMRYLIFGFLAAMVPGSSSAAVAISITVAPPILPVYVQPPCPQEGYLWTPGYWAWAPDGYYWVPGVWVAPPLVGLLWTPGYWGFGGGAYLWHAGYWGPHVGFYGGVDYGFGYPGVGFVGGVWAGNLFRYNTAVVNVNTAVVHNVYADRSVIRNGGAASRVSFNGPGGIDARPNAAETAAMRERHRQPTAAQASHLNMARADRAQRASVNHGNPVVAAMDSVNGRRFNNEGKATNNTAGARPNATATRNVPARHQATPNRQARAVPSRNAARPAPRVGQQTSRTQTHVSNSTPAVRHNAPAAHRASSEPPRQRQNPPAQRSVPAVRSQPRSVAASSRPRPAPAPHQQAARQPSAPTGHADREKRGK